MHKRTDIDDRKAEIINRLEAGESQRSLAGELDCKIDTLVSRLKSWNVAHLKNPNRKGMPHPEQKRDVQEYLIKGIMVSSHKLRLKLIAAGLKDKKCEGCGNDTWLGHPLMLELDHIDGDRTNNTLENLRILCPNCHSTTPTFRSRNRRDFKSRRALIIKEKIVQPSATNHCVDCNKIIYRTSTKCKQCATKEQPNKIIWPPDEELIRLVFEKPVSVLAKQLGVSDKAIAKRCKRKSINTPGRGYWAQKAAKTT